MRLGIAMAYQSQIVNEYCQDILFGIPKPHTMRVDLGMLDPDYVNVLPNGHEPFLGFAMVQLARKPEWQEKVKVAGAKGLRIIANIETGPVLHQLDQKIIYPHYNFKHLTEKYFEIGMKLDDFLIQLVKY